MIETLIYSLIGALMGGSITYVIAKRMLNTDKIIEISNELLTEITSDVEMQKKVYIVGAILGNGIKSGVGITGKGGKFKFEDVIGQALGSILGNIFPQKEPEQQQQQGWPS